MDATASCPRPAVCEGGDNKMPQRIGTLVGVDVIGILRLYGDDGGPQFVVKRMCGREGIKVPVAIEDGKAFVDGAEYKLVLRGHWVRS